MFWRIIRCALCLVILLTVCACARREVRYEPFERRKMVQYREVGIASWYGEDYHGRKTANGEVYDMYAMTAAHRTLPFQTRVRVTNLENGKKTELRINDRGPFIAGRIIDLSYSGARAIGMLGTGTAKVNMEAIGFAGGQSPSLQGIFAIQVGVLCAEGKCRSFSRSIGEKIPERPYHPLGKQCPAPLPRSPGCFPYGGRSPAPGRDLEEGTSLRFRGARGLNLGKYRAAVLRCCRAAVPGH